MFVRTLEGLRATGQEKVLMDGSVRANGRWGETLGIAAPLLLVAVGTVLSGRAGLVNIGQEGQLFAAPGGPGRRVSIKGGGIARS